MRARETGIDENKSRREFYVHKEKDEEEQRK